MAIHNQEFKGAPYRSLLAVLNERLGFQDGDPEQKIAAEVINWITVRPKKAHRLKKAKKALAVIGGSIMVTPMILAFSDRFVLGLNSDGFTLSALLIGGCASIFPFLLSLGKDHEPEDRVILKAIKNTEAQRQMSALLALRNEFAEGYLKMIYQSSEGNRSPIPSTLFRRLNSLNLLLPKHGIRRYIPKVDGLQHGRFFVSDGLELIPSKGKTVPGTQRTDYPSNQKGKFLLQQECDDFVAATELLNVKHSPHLAPHFRAIRLARTRTKKMITEQRKVIKEHLYDDVAKEVDGLSRSTVKKLFTGNCDTFEKAVIFPDATVSE